MSSSREDLLVEAIDRLRDKRFDWKSFNCAFAAAEIASAYCGTDYSLKFRSLCQGKFSARRILKRSGGLANIMKDLGFESVALSFARRGDCVLKVWGGSRGFESLGIVSDARKAVFPTVNGLAFVNVIECDRAWKVI